MQASGAKDNHGLLKLRTSHGNILLIRLKSIGDIVFTLPAVHAVREAFPASRIAFLTSKENESLLKGFADVQEIITIDRSRFQGLKLKSAATEFISLLRKLRDGHFELVVDLQGYGETALLTWLSGAPLRWGPAERRGRRWAYNSKAKRIPNIHPIEQHLALLSQCGLEPGFGKNHFVLPDFAAAEARQFFVEHGLDPLKRTLFVQPFTSEPHKNWPLENYISVGEHCRALGLQVLFGGGPAERQKLEPARQAGFIVAAGMLLLVSAGLAGLSTLVLGGNTGLIHVAVAMGKRVLVLKHSPQPNNGPPWNHPDWILLSPPNGRVSNIPKETVEKACVQALAELEAGLAARDNA